MAFTNNRNVFYNDKSFDEKLFANGLGMGTPSFVCKGLELTGTTLTSGVFNNTGAFGILGLEGETQEIPANYTGFIVIKTTMNSQNGFNEIITSATRLDTDQRDTSNIKYFTIYKLNLGVIEEDFRHSSYVKDISFENVGGSSFVQVINGTKSNPFDASTFAGNRTLLDDKDINYDDTLHSTSLLEDDLKEMRDNAITLVGNDKPLEIRFHCDSIASLIPYNPNLYDKIEALIIDKQGITGLGDNSFEFTMQCFTGDGILETNNDNSTKIIIDGNKNRFHYEFVFDYDNFAALEVMSIEKYIQKSPVVLKSGWSPQTNITLDGGFSINDFESISITEDGQLFRIGSFEVPKSGINTGVIAFGGSACGSSGALYTRGFNITVSNGGKTFSKTSSNTSMGYGTVAPLGSTFGTNDPLTASNFTILGHGCKSIGASVPLFMADTLEELPSVGDNMQETSVLKEVLDNA